VFQSRGPAVANERSPTVTSRDGGTSRILEVDKRQIDDRSTTQSSSDLPACRIASNLGVKLHIQTLQALSYLSVESGNYMIPASAILSQYTRVTDVQTIHYDNIRILHCSDQLEIHDINS